VARNPYEPPASPVSGPGRGQRGEPPQQVTWAVWLLRASLVIGYASLFLVDDLSAALGDVPTDARSASMVFFFIVLALTGLGYLWLIQCVKDGRNWARILMLVLTALGVFSMIAGAGDDDAPMVIHLIGVIDTVIDVSAMVLLYRAPASDWFAPKS
jgi:hypothetical protein